MPVNFRGLLYLGPQWARRLLRRYDTAANSGHYVMVKQYGG